MQENKIIVLPRDNTKNPECCTKPPLSGQMGDRTKITHMHNTTPWDKQGHK